MKANEVKKIDSEGDYGLGWLKEEQFYAGYF